MGKTSLIHVVAALSFAIAGAACSSARGDDGARDGRASGSGESATITGCLTSSADGRFALTAAPDSIGAAVARSTSDERETHSYVLVGGENLPSYLGKKVEVSGTLTGRELDVDMDAKTKASTRQTGGDAPRVSTTEEVELEVRKLNVSTVRVVAPTCTVNP